MSRKIDRSEHDFIRSRIKAGVPIQQIANEYGVTYQNIQYIMKKAQFTTPVVSKKPSDDDLYTMYIIEDKTQTAIAKELGVTPSTVCKWVKEAELEKEEAKDEMPENLIWEYEYGGCSAMYLANYYGFTYDQVRHWLDKHGAKKKKKGYQPHKPQITAREKR